MVGYIYEASERVRKPFDFRLHFLAYWLVVLLSPVSPADADYIPFNGAEVAPNIAEIHVGLDGISIQLEVFVEDIPKFEALVPDDWFAEPVVARPDKAVRLKYFAENGLSIRRTDGRFLPATIQRVEPRLRNDRANPLSGQTNPLTGQRFPAPPEDPRVLFVDLFYPFENERPDRVTISPPMTDEGSPVASIGMIVFDRDVPVTNFRFLAAPETLAIHWDDPWYSRFDNPALKRHHQAGVATFIYVEPREVRHETLIRLRDLDPWLSLDLATGQLLASDAQEKIKQQAAEFLAQRNPVRIDDQPVTPDSARTELLQLNATGFQVLEGAAPVNADAMFLGTILSFPISDLPDTVDVTWDMFDDRIEKVPATATDIAGPFISGASPDDPLIVWTNHLLSYENPQVQPVVVEGMHVIPAVSAFSIITAFCAAFVAWRTSGAFRAAASVAVVVVVAVSMLKSDKAPLSIRSPFERMPSEAEAQLAFADLLSAISVAHLEVLPKRRTEKLSIIASDEALIDVAAELDRGLAIRIPGGGNARTSDPREVSLSDVRPLADELGFRALATWSAVARAEHWGHRHVREVHFRALIEVLEQEGAWKLDGITVLEARIPNA